MKSRAPQTFAGETGLASPRLSAASFTRTPLGRSVLHLECLCHHPAAARFYLNGLRRNLRETASSARHTVLKAMRRTFGRRPPRGLPRAR